MNKDLKKIVSFPLLSKAGRAMKIPLPRHPRHVSTNNRVETGEVITFERVQEELKKITESKILLRRTPTKLKLSSCFRTISRSSNVKPTQVSPLSVSPPPTHYNPRYDFLKTHIRGAIAYHKSKSPSVTRFKKSSTEKESFALEGSKTLGTFRMSTSPPPKPDLRLGGLD
jgi:hypothetical protein